MADYSIIKFDFSDAKYLQNIYNQESKRLLDFARYADRSYITDPLRVHYNSLNDRSMEKLYALEDYLISTSKTIEKCINIHESKEIEETKKLQDICAELWELDERHNEFNSAAANDGNYNAKTLTEIELGLLKLTALNDTRINNEGVFDKFTDYQNAFLGNLGFFEYYFNDPEMVKDKTINELFMEYRSNELYSLNDYTSFILGTDKLVTFNENNGADRDLYLGSLILNGYGDLKIKDLYNDTNSKDGFDAITLTDKNSNMLVYFPFTNPYESDDILFDSWPLIERIFKGTEFTDDMKNATNNNVFTKAYQKYQSQLDQAANLVNNSYNDYLEYYNNQSNWQDHDDDVKTYIGPKVMVGGMSLGGNLAEYSYLNTWDNKGNSDLLGKIVLLNPYHYSGNEYGYLEKKMDSRMEYYQTQGDFVSAFTDKYSDQAKIICNDYEKAITDGKTRINEQYNSSLASMLLKNYSSLSNLGNTSAKGATEYLFSNLDLLDKNGYRVDKPKGASLALAMPEIFKNAEIIFSDIHMPQNVTQNKYQSFDENGNVNTKDQINPVSASQLFKMISGIEMEEFFREIKNIIYH